MAAFGEIAQDLPQDSQPAEATAPQGEVIDINDPRLTSEAMDDNTAADAYAVPPPAPDGIWRAKLKAVDIKDGSGQLQRYIAKSFAGMAGGRPFLVTNVEASLIDLGGKNDGVKLTEYWVKTLIDDRKGTSQASTITVKAGGPNLARSTDKDRMDALLKTLAGEPEVLVETVWEASCQACQDAAKKRGDKAPRPFLVGMHRFPQTRTGPDPMVPCPTCKAMARAQVRIARYFALAEAKATRGLS